MERKQWGREELLQQLAAALAEHAKARRAVKRLRASALRAGARLTEVGPLIVEAGRGDT